MNEYQLNDKHTIPINKNVSKTYERKSKIIILLKSTNEVTNISTKITK